MGKTQQSPEIFDAYMVSRDESMFVVQVSDPLQMEILRLVARTPMSATEISGKTGRALSTVSSHLDILTDRLLLDSSVDPEDNRRKVYVLKGRTLVHVKPGTSCTYKDLQDIYKDIFTRASKEKETFYKEFLGALVSIA